MSTFDRLFGALRDAVVFNHELKRLAEDLKILTQESRDHERRLIRLETLVEVASARSRPKALPRE